MMLVGLTLHLLATVIWVGGMFFAYVILRPSAGPLEPAVRLALWSRVFARFFAWVWLSIAALVASGAAMMWLGVSAPGPFVRTMMALALAMVAIYAWVYFVPWRGLRRAVSATDWPLAGRHLARIRVLVGLNLVLGLVTVATGVSALLYG